MLRMPLEFVQLFHSQCRWLLRGTGLPIAASVIRQALSAFFIASTLVSPVRAQPNFIGPLPDDPPLSDFRLEGVAEKDAFSGVPPLARTKVPGLLEVRIYRFGLILMEGGIPTSLIRLFIDEDGIDEATLYFICRTEGQPATGDRAVAWKVMQQEQFFTIPDDSNLPQYNRFIRDGYGYLVQIAGVDRERSFTMGNPAIGGNDRLPEAQRFLKTLRYVEMLFPAPHLHCESRSRIRPPSPDLIYPGVSQPLPPSISPSYPE